MNGGRGQARIEQTISTDTSIHNFCMSAIPSVIAEYIDNNADKFIQRLAKAVSIPSVSGDAAYRKYVYEMADWIEQQMKELGIDTKQVPVGTQILDGQELKLPNVVLGALGDDKSKKTVLLYGHFDVQPVRFARALMMPFWNAIYTPSTNRL
jgi:hypothetical protein